LFSRKFYAEAAAELEKAYALGAHNEEYILLLGMSYEYNDQCDKAIPWFQKRTGN